MLQKVLVILQTGLLTSLLVEAKHLPLHQLDNYVDCLKQFGRAGVYCVAQAYVKPNVTAQAWLDIIEHSKAAEISHFRYDRLSRGYCIQKCETKLKQIETTSFSTEKFSVDPWLYRPAPNVDINYTAHKKAYSELIQHCVNLDLREYELEAYTELDFCLTPETDDESFKNWDYLDYLTLAIIGLIGICTTSSTIYDMSQAPPGDSDHYQKLSKELPKNYVAFSIPRNWSTFLTVNQPNNGDYFEYFEGLRVLAMIMITCFHSGSAMGSISFSNPEDYETNTYSIPYKLFSGGSFTVQIFFTFTGFLLTLPLVKQVNHGKVLTRQDFCLALKNRLARIYPVMIFIILCEMSLVRKLGAGPIWTQLAGYEWGFCRKQWWTNILFINNFIGVDQMCLVQSK